MNLRRLLPGILAGLLVCDGSARGLEVCPAGDLVACSGSCTIHVPILVTGAAALDAVGFDFVFEDAKLDFRGVEPGRIVRGWQAFGGQLLPGARVRVGGFNDVAFQLNGRDTLAVLSFGVVGAVGCTRYHVEELVDDLAGAASCAGFSAWEGYDYPADGYVGVSPLGTPATCCSDTPDGTVLQVFARTAGGSDAGILGAEFRVEVSPPAPGAHLAWTPDPFVSSSRGDPIDNTPSADDSSGTVLAFVNCVHGLVPLGTIAVTGLAGEHDLLVRRHNRPSRPQLPCAQFTVCGERACEFACMAWTDAGRRDPVVFRARVNAPSCDPTSCGFVSVAARTWSNVKQMFR